MENRPSHWLRTRAFGQTLPHRRRFYPNKFPGANHTGTDQIGIIRSALIEEEAPGNFPRLVQVIDDAILRNGPQSVESLKIPFHRTG